MWGSCSQMIQECSLPFYKVTVAPDKKEHELGISIETSKDTFFHCCLVHSKLI